MSADHPRPVVVTRAEPPGGPLSVELERLGLPALRWPVVGTEPAACAETLREIATFDWIVFTSGHAVAAVTERLAAPPAARIAAVGPATARALRERGWTVTITAREPGAQGLVSALAEVGIRGQRVLYPASSRALPALGAGLARLGAEVVRFEAYRTVAVGELDLPECRRSIARGIGAVTFASPSAVSELESALGSDFGRLLDAAPAVVIGPTTARALSDRGRIPVIADIHTLRGLAQACAALMRGPPPAAAPEPDPAPVAGERLKS